MWAVENHTPYKVGRAWGRAKDGAHEWIVVVKATYNINPNGGLVLADDQAEPLLLPEHNGEDGKSSLRYDADLVAPKPATDVVINATAYAPRGRPSADFLVSAQIDRVRKVIRVRGNRRWVRGVAGIAPSTAEPVTDIPIVYERAYGGYDHTDRDPKNHRFDPRNPVGRGVVADPAQLIDRYVHNFEYPDGNPQKTGPAGYGALASYWSPRRELSGTYDEAWQTHRRPLLPADWDPRCLLCSPADQRPNHHLHGGEPVELQNLTRSGHLRFFLPKVFLTFRTYVDARAEEHRSHLSTVIIEPDYPRVIMVWATCLVCRTDVDYLEKTVVREKPYV